MNTGSGAVNLSGWKIVDKSATYTIGNVTIPGKGGKTHDTCTWKRKAVRSRVAC